MAFVPEGLVLHHKYTGQSVQRRGTIIDRSGNGNAGTVYGVPALIFDGVNDEALISTDPDLFGGSRMAVLVCHFYGLDMGATRTIYRESWQSNKMRFTVTYRDDNTIFIGGTSGSGDTERIVNPADTVSEGAWHSMIAVLDTEGEMAYLWIDGDEPAGWAGGVATGSLGGDTFEVGAVAHQKFGISHTFSDFKGKMKWMGLKGTSTLPTDADAQAYHDNPQAFLDNYSFDAYWYCDETDKANPNPQDQSGNAHHLTLTGATWDVTTNGGNQVMQQGGAGDSFYSGKRWFDGADDYVTVANATELIFGTADFQIHLWAAIQNTGADPEIIMVKGAKETSGWELRHNADEIEFSGDVDGTEIALTSTIGGSGITDGALHLISILRDGTDASVLIDGVSSGTDATANGDLSGTSALTIGGPTSFTTGDIYQVLVGKTPKTIAQGTADAVALYNQGAFV